MVRASSAGDPEAPDRLSLVGAAQPRPNPVGGELRLPLYFHGAITTEEVEARQPSHSTYEPAKTVHPWAAVNRAVVLALFRAAWPTTPTRWVRPMCRASRTSPDEL